MNLKTNFKTNLLCFTKKWYIYILRNFEPNEVNYEFSFY